MSRSLLISLVLLTCSACSVDDDFETVRKSAEQGHAWAQNNLGVMYDKGEGVPEDDAEAVRWYRRAAEQGDAYAQSNLGAKYGKGEGIPEDRVQAYAWFSIAAAQGSESAMENKEIIARVMSSTEIAEAQKLSRKYWEAYGPQDKIK